MRKMYEYKTIRYFPNALSDEFINIGVMLECDKPIERIITETEAKHLYCSTLIGENKKFYGVVEHVQTLAQKRLLREENQYFHNYTISESKFLTSDKSEEEILEGLFESYIGYKLFTEEKLDKRIKIIQQSFEIVKKEFSKHITIHNSKKFDFEVENIKNKKVYHANIGSLGNKHDIFKMTMETPPPTLKKDKDSYNFLDISTHRVENDAKERLRLYQIDVYDYNNEEKIGAYLEQLIVA